jgi:hypothetical protein
MNLFFKRWRHYKFFFLSLSFLLLSLTAVRKTRAQTIGVKDWAKRGGSWTKANLASGAVNNVLGMVTDTVGNVYILASAQGMIDVDSHTANPDSNGTATLSSWDCNGNFRWMKTFYGTSNAAIGVRNGLAADSLDGIYVTGILQQQTTTDTSYLDNDTSISGAAAGLFILKYNTSGVMQWLRMPYYMPNPTSAGLYKFNNFGLSVTPQGDLYSFAYLPPGAYANGGFLLTNNAYCVMHYNTNGVFQNNTILNMWTGNGTNSSAILLKRNNVNGNYCVYGSYNSIAMDTLVLGNTTVVNNGGIAVGVMYCGIFSSSGSLLWAQQGSDDKSGGIVDVAFDKDANTYFLGYAESNNVFMGDTTAMDTLNVAVPFITAVSNTRNKLWYSAAKNTGGEVTSIACSNGELYVYGSINGFINGAGTGGYMEWDSVKMQMTPTKSAYYLYKLTIATGKATAVDSIPISQVLGNNFLIADLDGNLYVSNLLVDSVHFGNDNLHKLDTSGNYADWFIAKFRNVNCSCHVLQPDFSIISLDGVTFNFNYSGQTPYTAIQWDFGDGTVITANPSPSHMYMTPGSYPVCVTVTNNCGSNTICHWVATVVEDVNEIATNNEIQVYPNPATDKLMITNLKSETWLEIYDVQGRRVNAQYILPNQSINISWLANGVYFLRLQEHEGNRKSGKFLKE